MVNHIASDPEQMLRALASERLGSSEEALSNPLVSASSGALSTAVGAIIPVIPFFFLQGSGRHRRGHRFAGRALRRGRSQEPHHRAVLVVFGPGDDRRRRARRRRHLRHRHSARQGRDVMGGMIPLGDASRRPRSSAAVTMLIIAINAYRLPPGAAGRQRALCAPGRRFPSASLTANTSSRCSHPCSCTPAGCTLSAT